MQAQKIIQKKSYQNAHSFYNKDDEEELDVIHDNNLLASTVALSKRKSTMDLRRMTGVGLNSHQEEDTDGENS
jgi:hypothetical protein